MAPLLHTIAAVDCHERGAHDVWEWQPSATTPRAQAFVAMSDPVQMMPVGVAVGRDPFSAPKPPVMEEIDETTPPVQCVSKNSVPAPCMPQVNPFVLMFSGRNRITSTAI